MENKVHWRTLIFLLTLFIAFNTYGRLKLPRLISDGMVLQRNAPVKVWGWADENTNVTVHFLDSTYTTVSDVSGAWSMVLPEYQAGGPYTMEILAGDTVNISNIKIGDVWICSGQSNMELSMSRVSWVYPSEIAHPEDGNIRQFYVPRTYNFDSPQERLESGGWTSATPENIVNFSAVAYFFGKHLYEEYGIPVGLINTSLGGSPVEAWMSEEALQEFPAYYHEAQLFKSDSLINIIKKYDQARMDAWYTLLNQKDRGYVGSGDTWYDPEMDVSDWATMKVPGYWAETETGSLNGVVWFRKDVQVPAELTGKPAKLILGRIVDSDSVFVNGTFVGTTGYQYPPRRYDIPPELLHKGENTIVVRVVNNRGRGGYIPDKPYKIQAEGMDIDLTGSWHYRVGLEMPALASQTFIRWKPVGLYNAMIAPLLNYRIAGAIWYQGESNADRPVEYRELFPAMIRDWRRRWDQGDFPFLYVQLPNYGTPSAEPGGSNWALLREAQLQTLSLPNTGMAVTIDIGEWNDIHPLNKEDVGKRLALVAQKVAYGEEDLVYSGPIYKSMAIHGDSIALSFKQTGSGLWVKGGEELNGFAIAGADSEFVRAEARIEDDRVVVWNENVDNPLAVRYAWADNPEKANLYNEEGLPASPFRTDSWNHAGTED